MLLTFLKGFGTGSGLIIAIGAQNAFVLSQGVKKSHYILIPLICAVCDAILIFLGVSGVGTLLSSNRSLSLIAGLGGASFLFFYGMISFRSVFKNENLICDQKPAATLKTAILSTLAVSLLNPHVYLDTIVLLGSIASQFDQPENLIFGAGAILASFTWFFSLSLGGKLLSPVFARQSSWKILNTLVGITMWSIAVSILKEYQLFYRLF